MRHTFTINGTPHTISDMTMLAAYSIIKLRPENRITAIKHFRSVTGMGLYESKQIIDFIADHANLRDNGDVFIEYKPPVITYREGT